MAHSLCSTTVVVILFFVLFPAKNLLKNESIEYRIGWFYSGTGSGPWTGPGAGQLNIKLLHSDNNNSDTSHPIYLT